MTTRNQTALEDMYWLHGIAAARINGGWGRLRHHEREDLIAIARGPWGCRTLYEASKMSDQVLFADLERSIANCVTFRLTR